MLNGFVMLLTNCPSGVAQKWSTHDAFAACSELIFAAMPVVAGVAGVAAPAAAGAAGVAGAWGHKLGVKPTQTASAAQKVCHVFMDRIPRIQGLSAQACAARWRREPKKKRDPESLWPILRLWRRVTLKNVPKLTVLCFLRVDWLVPVGRQRCMLLETYADRVERGILATHPPLPRRFLTQIEQ
jgi:hypothetical protein